MTNGDDEHATAPEGAGDEPRPPRSQPPTKDPDAPGAGATGDEHALADAPEPNEPA
jgi:hypothetical protein